MTPINLMSIGVASDHAGYELKTKVIKHLESKGCVVHDFGTDSAESVDYPDYAHKLASESTRCPVLDPRDSCPGSSAQRCKYYFSPGSIYRAFHRLADGRCFPFDRFRRRQTPKKSREDRFGGIRNSPNTDEKLNGEKF